MDTALSQGRAFSQGGVKPRAVIALLSLVFVIQWCVLPMTLTTTIGRDTVQILYWGQAWQVGYFKHPPLIAWIMELVTWLFGRSDMVSFGLAALVMLATFAIVYALARRYLDAWGAIMAAATLPAIGYYSYLVPHFNHNSLLMVFWALALFLGHLILVEGRWRLLPLLGVVFGLGILTKYTVLLLPGTFLLMVLATPRLRPVLLSPWAWLGVVLCFLVASPHLLWLAKGNLHPLGYMLAGAGVEESSDWVDHAIAPILGLAIVSGMGLSGLVQLLISLGRPRFAALSGGNASDAYLLWVFLGPIAIVLSMSVVSGGTIRNEWASPFLLTLPLAALHFGYSGTSFQDAMQRFLWSGLGFAVAMSMTFAVIILGYVDDVDEAKWNRFPARPLADAVESVWGRHCPGPVPVVIGDAWLAGTASHKMKDRPLVYTEADPVRDPWLNDDVVRRRGAVVLWNSDLSGRYRDIDHQDPAPPGVSPDWLSGPEELEARFGPLVGLSAFELGYPGPVSQPPVAVTLAVVPPAAGCGHR